MESFESLLYQQLSQQDDIIPKAIANFLFREVIENAHTKYSISQEDMREMCRDAVNRAAVLENVLTDPALRKALVLYGYSTEGWDPPVESEVTEKLRFFTETAQNIDQEA